jgi:hypothetical protein
MKNQTKITMILLIISVISVCIAGCTSESPLAQNESLNQSNISVQEPTAPVVTELPVVVTIVTEVPATVVTASDTTNATAPV